MKSNNTQRHKQTNRLIILRTKVIEGQINRLMHKGTNKLTKKVVGRRVKNGLMQLRTKLCSWTNTQNTSTLTNKSSRKVKKLTKIQTQLLTKVVKEQRK